MKEGTHCQTHFTTEKKDYEECSQILDVIECMVDAGEFEQGRGAKILATRVSLTLKALAHKNITIFGNWMGMKKICLEFQKTETFKIIEALKDLELFDTLVRGHIPIKTCWFLKNTHRLKSYKTTKLVNC